MSTLESQSSSVAAVNRSVQDLSIYVGMPAAGQSLCRSRLGNQRYLDVGQVHVGNFYIFVAKCSYFCGKIWDFKWQFSTLPAVSGRVLSLLYLQVWI